MSRDGVTLGETAPSRLRGDEPTLARYAGGAGWGLVVVGLAVVLANRATETPRLFAEGFGWFLGIAGVVLAMTHAAVETDRLLRRILGGVGAAFVMVGVGWGIAMAARERSWALGLIPAVPGLFLIALYVRKESDEAIRRPALLALGGVGLLLCLVGVLGTAVAPQWLPARFSVPLVLGLVLTLIYLGVSGVTDELAYRAALALGGLGALAFVGALLRAVVPTVIYEWRASAENEHLLAFAAGLSLLILGLVAMQVLGKPAGGAAETDANRRARRWGRVGAFAGGFLILLGVLRYFAPGILTGLDGGAAPPRPYLVPTGFVLMAAGLAYFLVALGFVSENRLVVMTRRELTAYFVSPIAYCVMVGFIFIATPSYYLFLGNILLSSEQNQPLPEPIVQRYVVAFFPVVAVTLAVPLLTMRLFAEEKRTGTLEVLLTAPVNDWLIVLSKFLAAWLFFMLLWLPWWLYLLALRLEGGQEFDFRPMIGFSLALLACGAAFVALGTFFSSLTRDQIIAAALTLMGMMILIGFYFAELYIQGASGAQVTAKAVVRALSFIHMWIDATTGKLYLRDVVVQLSVAAFWLFATVKVLEARRWS